MKSISKTLLLTLFMYSIAMVTRAQETGEKIMLIANPKGAPAEMKMSDVKSVFRGEKQRWADGTQISIAMMKTSTPIGEVISHKIYNMNGNELNKFWLALVFQGKAKAPVFFNTREELETYIKITPGSIGVVEEDGSRTLTPLVIDGKKAL
ncbi:MAG: hypothetical protein IT242_10845 [Bacteroidia bacterium]|nr:hypothetical protein [Bacteroidia bacterium]